MAEERDWVAVNWVEWLVAAVGNRSQRQVSLEAQLDASSINRMVRDYIVPRRSSIPALAKALGKSRRETYIAAGYIPGPKAQAALMKRSES